jgi:PleD family two-component response regulator
MIVENLSAGGALLVGDCASLNGPTLHVRLMIPGQRPIEVSARVLRREGRSPQAALAVAFQHVAPEIEDLIHEAVLASLNLGPDTEALVVHAPDDDARALVMDLEALGFQVIAVHTPLDALQALQEVGSRIGVVLVGPQPARRELMTTVADEFPGVRLVVVCSADDDTQAESVVGVRALTIRQPWSLDSMASTLGVSSSRRR